jgi:hypothetical protein
MNDKILEDCLVFTGYKIELMKKREPVLHVRGIVGTKFLYTV